MSKLSDWLEEGKDLETHSFRGERLPSARRSLPLSKEQSRNIRAWNDRRRQSLTAEGR